MIIKIISALAIVACAIPAMAGQVGTLYSFTPKTVIESSKLNYNFTALLTGVNDIENDQIHDSTIINANLGANCVGKNNICNLAIQARHIDSEVIADTMFSVATKNWILTSAVYDSAITGTDIQRNAIDYRHLNYSDTRNWDSMPVVMQTGYYVGNNGAPQFVATQIWPRTVYVYSTNPRVVAMTNSQRTDTVSYNVPYDTLTLQVEVKNPTVNNIDDASARGFYVYATPDGSGQYDLNELGCIYYYTIWGYRRE